MAKYSSKGEDKLFGWLSKKPLIWFHYILLEAILVVYMAFLGIHLFTIWFLLLTYAVLAFGDQAIHFVLRVD
jgi:hypothetical protein